MQPSDQIQQARCNAMLDSLSALAESRIRDSPSRLNGRHPAFANAPKRLDRVILILLDDFTLLVGQREHLKYAVAGRDKVAAKGAQLAVAEWFVKVTRICTATRAVVRHAWHPPPKMGIIVQHLKEHQRPGNRFSTTKLLLYQQQGQRNGNAAPSRGEACIVFGRAVRARFP
jgi:hypothetical protein